MTELFQSSTSGCKILVVGDVMLDRYVNGTATRISPEAPVPVVNAQHEDCRPGGAANVACNAQALGADCTLMGFIGVDRAGNELTEVVQSYGVTCRFVLQPDHITTEKTRIIAGTQQIVRVDRDGRIAGERREELISLYRDSYAQFDGLVFSDYAKGALDELPLLLGIAADAGIPTFVDPKCADPARYRGAFLVKPNAKEFRELFGSPQNGESIADQARAALVCYGWQHLVITLSAEGMLLVSADGTVRHLPTDAREVYDVSGAGDTVLAAIAVSYLGGASMAQAVAIGNVAAGIAVNHAGTCVVSKADIEHRARIQGRRGGKIVTVEELGMLIGDTWEKRPRVVFTNGCFDILHGGHVKLLREARAFGDVLVVGLNSDQSIRRLKGPTRPVNELADRCAVLESLACVDYIVPFDEDTPRSLIESLKPDVLVKGGDYRVEDIVGSDFVMSYGGRVELVDLLSGRSTTAIIDRSQMPNAK